MANTLAAEVISTQDIGVVPPAIEDLEVTDDVFASAYESWEKRVNAAHDYSLHELDLIAAVNSASSPEESLEEGYSLLVGFAIESARARFSEDVDQKKILNIGRQAISESLSKQAEEGPEIILQEILDDIDQAYDTELEENEELQDLYTTVTDRTALSKILNHRVLLPQEEVILAKRIERGDLQAKQDLMLHNMRLVNSRVKKYVNHGLDYMDLFDEGVQGLIRATEKFDYRKGFKFSTYATHWIDQAIQRGIENKGRPIRIPVHKEQLIRRLKRIKAELEQELEREATVDELSSRAKVDPDEIKKLERLQTLAYLDKPIGDGEATLADVVPDSNNAIEAVTEGEGIAEEILGLLSADDRRIVELKLGFGEVQERTFHEVGKVLGIAESSAKARYHRVIERLTNNPESHQIRRRLRDL